MHRTEALFELLKNLMVHGAHIGGWQPWLTGRDTALSTV